MCQNNPNLGPKGNYLKSYAITSIVINAIVLILSFFGGSLAIASCIIAIVAASIFVCCTRDYRGIKIYCCLETISAIFRLIVVIVYIVYVSEVKVSSDCEVLDTCYNYYTYYCTESYTNDDSYAGYYTCYTYGYDYNYYSSTYDSVPYIGFVEQSQCTHYWKLTETVVKDVIDGVVGAIIVIFGILLILSVVGIHLGRQAILSEQNLPLQQGIQTVVVVGQPNPYGQPFVQQNPQIVGQVVVQPNPYGQVVVQPNPYGQQVMQPNLYGQQPNLYGQPTIQVNSDSPLKQYN